LTSKSPEVAGVPLPGNPNCVAFAASARDVLADRSWGRVQELARGVLERFHSACELPIVVGFAGRMALDRKNRRQSQVCMYFLFDGPASVEHMDLLDATMAHNPVAWSDAHIERLPANGVSSLFAVDGRVHLVVRQEADGLRVSRLRQRGHAVRVRDDLLEELGPDDVLVDLPRVCCGPPTYGEAERHVERLRLAFALQFAQRIVEADGIVRDDEAEFMSTVFSHEALSRLRLVDASDQQRMFDEALEVLPSRLGHHDKLALIGLFFTACYSDGTLDAREMRVLKDASDALGVERTRVVKYLQRFW
jgi:uncharacterized tellurite resistance protein B-like protein